MITNETGGNIVHSILLIPTIHKALSSCKRYHPKKRDSSTFPKNPWYDEECKVAKRSIKERNLGKQNKKKYEKLVR
jgi:hypothetical protein